LYISTTGKKTAKFTGRSEQGNVSHLPANAKGDFAFFIFMRAWIPIHRFGMAGGLNSVIVVSLGSEKQRKISSGHGASFQ
jgi:hypothetical protein